jgi:co-chaperonin GroES (HSP10)
MTNIRLTSKRCLVDLGEKEAVTASGLHIPATAQKCGVLHIGTVVQIGPDVEGIEVGKKVLCAAGGAHRIDPENERVVVMSEARIFVTLN